MRRRTDDRGHLVERWLRRGLAVLTAASAPLGWAQEALGQAANVGGFVSVDRRFGIGGDSVTVANFYNRFRPELSVSPAEDVYLFASLDIRSYDFPDVKSENDLEDPESHFPTDVTLWEGYVQLWSFLTDDLDLRVGKQRIQWGTADKLNPTDQVNGYDLSDLVDFTARVPTWAVQAEYYIGGLAFTAVWSPTVHAPIMPRGGAALFFGGSALGAGDLQIDSLDLRIQRPSNRISNGFQAVKVAGNVAGADYSLSYMTGYDGVPYLKRVDIRAPEAATGAEGTEGLLTLGFTRAQTAGADLALEVGGIGVWGEGALVFPRSEEGAVSTTVGATTSEDRFVALDSRTYLRSTIGLDYTFFGGWYANLQWAHGLFFERGADDLHDYFVGRVERSLFRGELELALGGSLEFGTWEDVTDNLGYGIFPEITYAPADNLELQVGAFLVGGRGSSLFGAWDEADQLYTRVKVSF